MTELTGLSYLGQNIGMAKYTIYAEIRDTRAAIKSLLRGAKSATISSNGGQHSYTRTDLSHLREHLTYLEGKVSRAKLRKRTAPDFS